MKNLEIHPIAKLFPGMLPDEWTELVADIDANGLHHPIILYEGMVLDGRHRYLVCEQLKIEPKFETYDGDDPIGFCISANIRRRHLTLGQKALLAVELRAFQHGGDRKSTTYRNQVRNSGLDPGTDTQAATARALGISEDSITVAAAVKAADPELAAKVRNGHVTLHVAEVTIAQTKKVPKDETPRDETGWPIPENLLEFWERRDEITEPMTMIRKLENHLKAKQMEKDPLFAPISFASAIMTAQRLHMEIRAARLFAVCPQCQGRLPDSCNLCKTRGFIDQRMWQTGIPEETKTLRQNILDNKKVNL